MKAIDREKFREALFTMLRARERMQSNFTICDEAKKKAKIEISIIKTVLSMTNNMAYWWHEKS